MILSNSQQEIQIIKTKYIEDIWDVIDFLEGITKYIEPDNVLAKGKIQDKIDELKLKIK